MSRPPVIGNGRPGQRGVASLVVVAVLFFILALVAAYTNRSMIFEQRTSANQYRATQAFEAAEAGVDWALAMLNSGRIDDTCAATADVDEATFRDRYLDLAATTGRITPAGVLAPDGGGTRWPGCVFDGTDWDCGCPEEGKNALTPPAGAAGVFPAFRVRFVNTAGARPGVVQLEVNGCTSSLLDECLDFPARGVGGEGRATLRVLVALRGGLAAPPLAAVTVQGNLDGGGGALGAFNGDTASGGVSIQAGGTITGSPRVGSAPGTPAEASKVDGDTGLSSLPSGERLFINTFALSSTDYREQPGAVVLVCGGGCDAGDVRSAAERHPGHVIWAPGNLDLDTGGDIGSPEQPVLIVATGDVTVDVPLYGLLYGRGGTWSGAAGNQIRGALVSEGDFTHGADGAGFDVIYDPDVLQRLRWRTGSFVRVPGGWRDY